MPRAVQAKHQAKGQQSRTKPAGSASVALLITPKSRPRRPFVTGRSKAQWPWLGAVVGSVVFQFQTRISHASLRFHEMVLLCRTTRLGGVDTVLHENEVVFFFLDEVQPQECVQTVEARE